VIYPVVGETGALGVALQALWCFDHQMGSSTPLQEITDDCVTVDPEKRAEPITENVDANRNIFIDTWLPIQHFKIAINRN
jgi:hypothetical protein